LEALERIKEEESKKFKSHDIHFDFNILTLIKELMVDVSSSCMELALKVPLVLILQRVMLLFVYVYLSNPFHTS